MSLVHQPADALLADILRQNTVANLLRKSFDIHVSSTTSAMIERISFIETCNPEFLCRTLLIATGYADQNILNAFLEDFWTLGTMSPNVRPLQIDFKYVVDIPKPLRSLLPDLSTSVVVRQRKALVAMLLFIIAYPHLNLPSGAYRINCLELITALHGSLKEHCLRIISDLASYEDIHMFDTNLRDTQAWRDFLIEGDGDTEPKQ